MTANNKQTYGAVNKQTYGEAKFLACYCGEMKFGDRVKRFREASGLSQPALAKQIGVSQATISQIESGDSASSKHIFKLAKALSVRPIDLDPDIPADTMSVPDGMVDVLHDMKMLSETDQKLVIAQLRGLLDIVKVRGKAS